MVPLATPDEPAYLIAARVLAGGVPANFSYSTLYPAGYPLLITPVYWFANHPVTVRIIENSIQRNIGRWLRGRNQETC